MPPPDYQQARDDGLDVAWIDGRPYLPKVYIGVSGNGDAEQIEDDCSSSCNDKRSNSSTTDSAVDIAASVKLAVAKVLHVWYQQQQHQQQKHKVETEPSSALGHDGAMEDDDDDDSTSFVSDLVRQLDVELYEGGVTNTLYKATFRPCNDKSADACSSHQQLQELLDYCARCGTGIPTLSNGGKQPTAITSRSTNGSRNGSKVTFSPIVLLVRVFGAIGMIDRDQESSIFAALSSTLDASLPETGTTTSAKTTTTCTIAPPYYGRLANGRVEGWMNGMRPLQTRELPHFARGIAHSMAVLHVGFAILPETVVPGTSSSSSLEPTVFDQLYNWLEQAEQQLAAQSVSSSKARTNGPLDDWIPQMRRELQWLQALVKATTADSNDAIVFCHNDLLAANILCPVKDNASSSASDAIPIDGNSAPATTTTASVQLIDFEYGGINYRAFDIANHFNEYAGGPPDCAIPKYKEHFPNLSQQRHFIECYLQAAARVRQNRNRNLQHDKCNGSAHNHSTEAAAAAAIAAPTEVTEHDEQDETAIKQEDVDALMVEVELFLLVNHLYWGLWAVNQGTASATSVASSTTDNAIETSTAHKVDLPDDVAGYDYTTYAIQRIQQYWIAKARYEEERSKPC